MTTRGDGVTRYRYPWHDNNHWQGVPYRYLGLMLWYISTRGER